MYDKLKTISVALLIATVSSCGVEPSKRSNGGREKATEKGDVDSDGGDATKKQKTPGDGTGSDANKDDCVTTNKKSTAKQISLSLADNEPTYADVSSIMKKYCTSCHSGGTSPTLTSYTQVSRSIDSVISSVESGRMPKGIKKLTSDEKAMLKDWRSAGTPESALSQPDPEEPGDDDGESDGESDGETDPDPKETESKKPKDPCSSSKKPPTKPQDLSLTGAEVDKLIAADSGGNSTLYVTFHELKDEPDFARDLDVYRFGVTKAMNHLSIKPDIVKLRALDEAGIVNAIDLTALGLTQKDVDTMMKAPDSSANARGVGGKRVMNGDWFVYAMTRPEVYDVIVRIPNNIDELEKQMGTDRSKAVTAEIKPKDSEIVFGRRVLERIPMAAAGQKNGYYWRSYDYVFNNSDGLVAGEMIYSLPNGLQGYMLIGFVGQHRWDAQPFVATDVNREADGIDKCAEGSHCGYVINGESCITCHANGMKGNENFFNFQGTGAEQFQKLMDQDTKRFTDAVGAMGFEDPGVEPVLATLKAYRARSGNEDKREGGGEVAPVAPRGTIWNRK